MDRKEIFTIGEVHAGIKKFATKIARENDSILLAICLESQLYEAFGIPHPRGVIITFPPYEQAEKEGA